MTRRILLALERTDDETAVVPFARMLAQRRHAEILLARVEEWPLVGPFGFGWASAWRGGALDALKSELEDHGGVPTRILSRDAVPSSALLPQARQRAASLILMPYRHEHTFFRAVHGHPTDRVLRESPVPVLAVPVGSDAPPPRVTKILYLYEGGEGAVPGLRHAIDFAQLFEARIVLQHVPPAAHPEEGFLPSLLFRGKEERDRVREDQRSLENRLLWILKRREVPAEVLPPAVDPVRDVLHAVTRHRIDLVHLAPAHEPERARLSLLRHVLQEPHVPVLLTREGTPSFPPADVDSRVRVGI